MYKTHTDNSSCHKW